MNPQFLKRSLKYVLIPGKPEPGSPALSYHNRAFEFWYPFWKAIFKNLGETQALHSDPFLRQDFFSLLMQGDRVIALHGSTFLDWKQLATRELSYFKNSYTNRAIEKMSEFKATRLMTLEHFSVAPDWRDKIHGFSLAAMLVCLALKEFEVRSAELLLGISRVDLGVAKMAYEFGAEPLEKNVVCHGVPCDLIAIQQGHQRPYKNPLENDLANFFWEHRLDFAVHLPASNEAARAA